MFERNFDKCKNDEIYTNSGEDDYTFRSECATMAPFAMPVGWKDYKNSDIKFAYYTVHDPNILPRKDKLENNEEAITEPKTIDNVVKDGNHQKFHKWCPMYDYNLRKGDEKFHSRTTCCNHANKNSFKNLDATYVVGNFEIFQKHNLYQIYPKCYDLLRYMPCMVCDPRVQDSNYTFQVGERVPDGFKAKIPVLTYRLCDDYATEIWKQCRRAFFLTNGRKLVVPKNMGLEQFKEMVGVPKSPSEKCFDISDVNPFY